MSRSGYNDECDNNWSHIMWRGRVASATKGKRGQALLRDLLAALDAMPEKRLIKNNFVADGAFCTLGVLGAQRGLDMSNFVGEDEYDVECDHDEIARAFDIASPLAREIMYLNDECISDEKCVEVEIVGPVRPHWPDYGSHKRSMGVPDPKAGERRWKKMRDWVAGQIKHLPSGDV